jgi:NADH-quinone oxidoreductase subunit N
MTIHDLSIMRNELILTGAAMLILLAEIFTNPAKKKSIITISLGAIAIVTAIVLIPAGKGSLFGGMFVTSHLLQLMKSILSIGALIVMIQSVSYLGKAENSDKVSEYYILILSTLAGMFFMISSGHFLMFYLGLELATIPIAALAAFDRYKNKSAEAGIKLILSSALSSGIMLYGISLIYGSTGGLYFEEVRSSLTGSNLEVLAFIFFFAGMAFKISIVPFHLWTADVYEGAPVNITSYLSVISKGAAVLIFIIIAFTVFPVLAVTWKKILIVTSILTMTIGNLFAIRQKNLKRFLAFSSISQAGYILLGIVGANQTGMASVIYYILVYVFSNLGAFGVVSLISDHTGKENIDDYNGLYKAHPRLSLIMTLALFSLAGIPPVAGFFGKFFLFTAAAQEGYYLLVLIAVLNTIISLYYYLLVVKAMFINKNNSPVEHFNTGFAASLGLAICVAGIVITGFASIIFETIRSLSFGL